MTETRKPIVVVGSVTMDMVTRTPQIPRVGQTVIGTSFSTTPGGKGANQAVAAARLGYPVQLIGMVGDDVFGPAIAREPRHGRRGHLRDDYALPDRPVSRRSFLPKAARTAIVVVPGANGKVDSAYVDKHVDVIRNAGMVLCQLELPMATVDYTLALCARIRCPGYARSSSRRRTQRSRVEAGRMVHSKRD